jgi:hypothetical protein
MAAGCDHQDMIGARIRWLGGVVVIALLGGCGSGGGSPSVTHSSATHSTAAPNIPQTIPDPAPTGITAKPAAVRVIKLWAADLRRGDVRAAARWFALPSVMINGGAGDVSVNRIHTPRQAQAANEMLPCGAKFLSADMRGRYVNALFELTGRSGPGGTNCGGGAGGTARTNFVIADGRIVEWIRAPDDPGENSSGPTA